MKFCYTIAIVVLLVCISTPVVYAQSTTNSKSQFNKTTMIRQKLLKAQECIEKGDYNGAKSYLNGALNLDKNNIKAKQLLANCNNREKTAQTVSTTLSVSKSNLSFAAVGGAENISVTTNSSSYSIALLPIWCSVQKFSNYFVITCNKNIGSEARTDYFTVSVADKSIRVIINQIGALNSDAISSNKEAITLSVSKDYLYFEPKGGRSESVNIYSNASSYSVSLVPSWCSVQTFNGYVIVTCNANYNSQGRNDWFTITAGNKEKKVYIVQKGLAENTKSQTRYKSKTTDLYLGAGLLKPLIFKLEGSTFSNENLGYNFTIGIVKTIGVYAKISTNFSSETNDFTTSDISNVYYSKPNSSLNTTFNRFGIVGGLMLKLDPVIFYVGAGNGYYKHYVETDLYNYLDDNYAKTINLTSISHNGLETDAGLIINFNKVGLSFGVSSIEFKYMEINLGLGIRL